MTFSQRKTTKGTERIKRKKGRKEEKGGKKKKEREGGEEDRVWGGKEGERHTDTENGWVRRRGNKKGGEVDEERERLIREKEGREEKAKETHKLVRTALTSAIAAIISLHAFYYAITE